MQENESEIQNGFVRKYWGRLAVAGVILTGIITGISTYEKSPTLVRGTILEEKYVPQKEKIEEKSVTNEEKDATAPSKEKSVPSGKEVSGPLKYMIHVKVYEPIEIGEKKERERLCTLYVKEDSNMPIAVLDEVLSAGSDVYLHYFEQGLTFHKMKPLYPIGCFGMINSSEIKAVHPWESSEAVKKTLEDHLEKIHIEESKRASEETREYSIGKTIF